MPRRDANTLKGHIDRRLIRSLAIFCFLIIALALLVSSCGADTWKVTAYCSCSKCCGKADGITASGKVAEKGYCALNWLPFGTLVEIDGLGTFKVQDRGAKSLFGTKKNKIKHIDVWFPTHAEAKRFGVKWLDVKILEAL